MSSRAVFALLLVLIAGPLGAQDWEAFAAASERSSDAFIVQTLAGGDLDTSISLCKGVGRRKDLDVQTIIDWLVAERTPGSVDQSELLLRWLLASAQEANPRPEALGAWAAANSRSVDRLLERMPRWRSAQLKGALLRLTVIAPGTLGSSAIMDVGLEVVGELDGSPDGLIPSQDTALALDFLAAARQAAKPAFFDLCVSIARLSREKVLVDAARAAARDLASRP